MKKVLKVLLVTGVVANMFAISAFADTSNEDGVVHNRAPVETVVDGQRYIDGLPYYTSEDIKKIDTAQDENNSAVDKLREGMITPFGIGAWTIVSTASYYTGQDYDRVNNYTGQAAKMKVSTTSSMTGELSGSAKFNFATVAEMEMSLKEGETFSKTTDLEVTVPGYHVTELKTACKAIQRNYRYTDNYSDDGSMGPIVQYEASSYDNNGGIEMWLFDNPIK